MSILYVIIFILLFYINIKKHGFNTASLLVFIYLVSSIFTQILTSTAPSEYNPNDITLDSVVAHVVLLFLFMSPIIHVGNKILISELIISDAIFSRFVFFVIVCGLSGIIVSYWGIIEVLSAPNFEAARFDALAREDTSYYSYGLIGYLATIGTMTPMFAIFCAFYRLFVHNKTGIILYLLILSSFSGAFLNFAGAGRDGFVRWALFMVFNIVLFKNQISLRKIPKILLLILIVFGSTIVTLFIAITIARFGEGDKGWMSVMEYIGQSFYHFSNTFHGVGNENHFGFNSIFPLFPGANDPLSIARISNFNFRTDVFPTFVGSFVLKVGYINTFALGVTFFIIYTYLSRYKRLKLYNIVAYMIFYQVAYIGIFYFVFAMLARQLSFLILYMLSKYKIKINNLEIRYLWIRH